MSENLKKALIELQEDKSLDIIKDRLEEGEDPRSILKEVRDAMKRIGDRFDKGEYFISELVYSGEILEKIMEIVKPKLEEGDEEEDQQKEVVVLGTVEGDIHNIGKDLLAFMLDINGFEVHDLGVDVPSKEIVDAIRDTNAKILGLSGFLTLAFDAMKETIEDLETEGLTENLKIMIGGGQIDEDVRKYTGADAYGDTAMDGVKIAKKWSEGE